MTIVTFLYKHLNVNVYFLLCICSSLIVHKCTNQYVNLEIYFILFQKDSTFEVTQSFLPNASNVDWTKITTILDTLSVSYINYHLPREHQSIWRFLYSNSLHGDSFSQLTRYVVGKGPNVILVQDKDGHLFGAYVSHSWEIKPTFYGNSSYSKEKVGRFYHKTENKRCFYACLKKIENIFFALHSASVVFYLLL